VDERDTQPVVLAIVLDGEAKITKQAHIDKLTVIECFRREFLMWIL
jgi:hypothetical protein